MTDKVIFDQAKKAADATVPEDGRYSSWSSYLARWLIARDAAIHALEFVARKEPSMKDEPVARKTFPILGSGGQTRIDWQLVADHARQANKNHRQTVERLAERGGLSWDEMLAVLTDRSWRDVPAAEKADAVTLCRAIEARYLAATRPADDLVRQLVEVLDIAVDEYDCINGRVPDHSPHWSVSARDLLTAARAAGYGGDHG